MYKTLPASTAAIPVIRELVYQVWPQTYQGIITQGQIEYMLEKMYAASSLEKQMVDEACTFILLYDDDQPAGFASFGPVQHSVFKLHKLYVLPGEQGKGGGRFMIDHIISILQKQGVSALQLQVNRNNKALHFYERLGFTTVEEINLDIGNGYYMNDYMMEKQI